MSNVFRIADDMLIAGFDDCGKDCKETLEKVLLSCKAVVSILVSYLIKSRGFISVN